MASYESEQEKLRRRRALAQAMSAIQQPQGQMVGRQFVAPSPLERLATTGQQLAGALMERGVNRKEDELKAGRQKQLADALRGMIVPPGEGSTPAISAQSSSAAQTPEMASGQSTISGQSAPDPQRESMLQFLQSLPMEQQEALVGQQTLAKLFPAKAEGFTLKDGEKRFDGSGKVIAEVAPTAKDPVAAIQEYQQAQKDGFQGSFLEYQLALKKAGASNVTTSVNTEKNLYGTMADAQGKANVDLYAQAQKAPELLNRAQRVKTALAPGNQVITGAGAEQLLGLAKIAAQFGFNTGDAAADTEALSRELASATLDNIRASGLGGGQGFSNADRNFLEKAVGGKITLEAKTLQRLADLNEKSAMATIQRWNATASRLKPQQLQELGMAPIEMPAGTPPPSAKPKLTQNPDGSYNYSP